MKAKVFFNEFLLPILKSSNYKKYRNSYVKLEDGELLKGYSIIEKDFLLGINWFFMPLIPKKNVIVLNYGERLRDQKGGDLFNVRDYDSEEVFIEINELIQHQNQILDKINSINDFYYKFLETEALKGIRHKNFEINPRHFENVIHIKVYLGLDISHELIKFYQLYKDYRHDSPWIEDVKDNLEKLISIKDKGELRLKNYLDGLILESIKELKLPQ